MSRAFADELVRATRGLPTVVRMALSQTLRSGSFEYTAGSYDNGGGGRCPIAAAAAMAGVWSGRGVAAGNPQWGTEDSPSEAVEAFAAYFDLCAEETSVAFAVAAVARELEQPDEQVARAA